MTEAEQTELIALRELEKAVRADRDGCVYHTPGSRASLIGCGTANGSCFVRPR